MIRFSFRQLSYFVAVAEHGSTLRASQALNLSQPAISVAIAQLEDVFQQKLFVRRPAQGVDLTPFGRRKLTEVRHLLAIAQDVSGAGSDGELSGELDVAVFSTLAPAFAPGILRSFKQAYPNARVRLREEDLGQIHRDLDAGVFELALLYDLDAVGAIERTVVGEFMPHVLLPKGHSLEALGSVSLERIAMEPFILIDLPHSRDYFLSLFRMAGVMPSTIIRCSSLETVRGMVANNHGVSILVTKPFSDRCYDGRQLTYLPLSDAVPPQRAIIGSSIRSPVTRLARAFTEVTLDYFAKLPDNVLARNSELSTASDR